jgi:hypothetical protein
VEAMTSKMAEAKEQETETTPEVVIQEDQTEMDRFLVILK